MLASQTHKYPADMRGDWLFRPVQKVVQIRSIDWYADGPLTGRPDTALGRDRIAQTEPSPP